MGDDFGPEPRAKPGYEPVHGREIEWPHDHGETPKAKRDCSGEQLPVSEVAAQQENPFAFLEGFGKVLFSFEYKIVVKIRFMQPENVREFKHHLAEVHIDFSQQLPWPQIRVLAATALSNIVQSHRLSSEGNQIGQETKDFSDALSQTKGDEGHHS